MTTALAAGKKHLGRCGVSPLDGGAEKPEPGFEQGEGLPPMEKQVKEIGSERSELVRAGSVGGVGVGRLKSRCGDVSAHFDEDIKKCTKLVFCLLAVC